MSDPREPSASAPPDEPPYRIWSGTTTFRKDGTPVLGTMGRSAGDVVVMDVETFLRLVRHPALATVKWELAHV